MMNNKMKRIVTGVIAGLLALTMVLSALVPMLQ